MFSSLSVVDASEKLADPRDHDGRGGQRGNEQDLGMKDRDVRMNPVSLSLAHRVSEPGPPSDPTATWTAWLALQMA